MTGGLFGQPRVSLMVTRATPLVPARRLSRELDVEVWLKRDDLTGVGLGGNKIRALEYLLADAEARGADSLVTGSGPQSNWAMLAGLTARMRGLDAFLVHYGNPVDDGGNARLNALAGAEVRFTGDPDRASVDHAIEALGDELRARGRCPYVLPRGGATPRGALGYVRATLELAEQLDELGLAPAQLWLPTGSCGTQAGLVAGTRWLGLSTRVVGVTVSRPVGECRARIAGLTESVLELLGANAPTGGDLDVRSGYLGPGYGRSSPEGRSAAELVARAEGVFLDPVFGAKAMAALIAECRRGRVVGPVVFLVTGGAPTLFVDATEESRDSEDRG